MQGRKVREIADRLAMSESDLYRKQRVAIGQLARVLTEMEQENGLVVESLPAAGVEQPQPAPAAGSTAPISRPNLGANGEHSKRA